jgi:hypothetical protein
MTDHAEWRSYWEEGFFRCSQCGIHRRGRFLVTLRTHSNGYEMSSTARCTDCYPLSHDPPQPMTSEGDRPQAAQHPDGNYKERGDKRRADAIGELRGRRRHLGH